MITILINFETSEVISSLVGWCKWLWELFFFIFPLKKILVLFCELVHEVRPKSCVWVLSGRTSIPAEGNGPEARVTAVRSNRRPPQPHDLVSEGRAVVAAICILKCCLTLSRWHRNRKRTQEGVSGWAAEITASKLFNMHPENLPVLTNSLLLLPKGSFVWIPWYNSQ